ncbi:hypothetical protein C8R44DRAFT_754656 [Mycena epipterygia]|nr:hypothetical protein C8R44DRAFT_754656 [Mycena epipterygia]
MANPIDDAICDIIMTLQQPGHKPGKLYAFKSTNDSDLHVLLEVKIGCSNYPLRQRAEWRIRNPPSLQAEGGQDHAKALQFLQCEPQRAVQGKEGDCEGHGILPSVSQLADKKVWQSSAYKQVMIGLDHHVSNSKFAMIATKPRATKGLV